MLGVGTGMTVGQKGLWGPEGLWVPMSCGAWNGGALCPFHILGLMQHVAFCDEDLNSTHFASAGA